MPALDRTIGIDNPGALKMTALRLIVLSVLLALGSPAFAEITGKPRVIDGDTIEIAGQRIRLHGIDAPERGQLCKADGKPWRCGQEATFALADIIGRTWVDCVKRGTDRYGRVIAMCRVGGSKGKDLGAKMVSEGWALAYRKYSMDYVAAEDTARAAGRGLWRGKFIAPWEWRRGKRLASDSPKVDRPCRIKGNIGKRGVRIYHVPGGAYYNKTRINEEKRERWFCTEAEARAAGWRRSKR
jgi:endonuclease YncB( thermonuclease family)